MVAIRRAVHGTSKLQRAIASNCCLLIFIGGSYQSPMLLSRFCPTAPVPPVLKGGLLQPFGSPRAMPVGDHWRARRMRPLGFGVGVMRFSATGLPPMPACSRSYDPGYRSSARFGRQVWRRRDSCSSGVG